MPHREIRGCHLTTDHYFLLVSCCCSGGVVAVAAVDVDETFFFVIKICKFSIGLYLFGSNCWNEVSNLSFAIFLLMIFD